MRGRAVAVPTLLLGVRGFAAKRVHGTSRLAASDGWGSLDLCGLRRAGWPTFRRLGWLRRRWLKLAAVVAARKATGPVGDQMTVRFARPAVIDRRSREISRFPETRSVCTCQGLRPRRAIPTLALSRPYVLPSAHSTASAPGIMCLSRLWLACALPSDASPVPSRPPKLGTLARKRVYSEAFRTGDHMTTPLVGKCQTKESQEGAGLRGARRGISSALLRR